MRTKISFVLVAAMFLSGWLFFGPQEVRGQQGAVMLPNGKVAGELPKPSQFPEPIAAYNTFNWFVQNNLGVGTDAPTDDVEIKASVPFLLLTDTGSGNAGIGFTNPVDPDGSFIYMTPDADMRFFVGLADRMTINTDGFVGIGTTTPGANLHIGQTDGTASPQLRMSASSGAASRFPNLRFVEQGSGTPVGQLISDVAVGRFVFDYCSACGGDFTIRKAVDSGNAADVVLTASAAGDLALGGATLQAGAKVTVNGNLHVNGNVTKTGAGALVRIKDGEREFEYSASVGPEVGTYVRGTARLENGKAVIELPEHFAAVTSKEGLTVQLTLLDDCNGLRVVEKGTGRIVVSELMGGSSNAKFDYLVQGIRNGQENHQVVYAR